LQLKIVKKQFSLFNCVIIAAGKMVSQDGSPLMGGQAMGGNVRALTRVIDNPIFLERITW
jgi:ABC-type tungstate transport system substrate-binding protein